MTPLIELAPGKWIQPHKVCGVMTAGKGKCTVFTSGQSAVDGGFLVEKDVEDVVNDINDELLREE